MDASKKAEMGHTIFPQKKGSNLKTSTVEPRFLDNAVNGYPPLVYNKQKSENFLAFCNAKLPLDNGHAFSGESAISVKYFGPK